MGKYLPYLGRNITEMGLSLTEMGVNPTKNGKKAFPIFDILLPSGQKIDPIPILILSEANNAKQL